MLTTVQIRALKPAARPFKVPDADGLFLIVQPSGTLLWRFRYKVLGHERKLSLGSFPDRRIMLESSPSSIPPTTRSAPRTRWHSGALKVARAATEYQPILFLQPTG